VSRTARQGGRSGEPCETTSNEALGADKKAVAVGGRRSGLRQAQALRLEAEGSRAQLSSSFASYGCAVIGSSRFAVISCKR
jgi:hypothetical protein